MTDTTEQFLHDAFEANFERLKEECGRVVTPDVKEAALQQVLLYWQKLRTLAEQVTETEVHLVLPDQQSPEGRRYTLEGVVDIVREHDETIMYDLKTYLDAETAGADTEPHFKQLNVYAHIWQTLRGQPLDAVAVIATRPPPALRHALGTRDHARIEKALAAWDPVLPIPVRPEALVEVIADFGGVVDAIEGHCFAPPPVDVLLALSRPNSRVSFGTDVCGNCDARFSCSSYRQFILRTRQAQRPEVVLNDYYADFGVDADKDVWLDANVPTVDLRPFDLGDDDQ